MSISDTVKNWGKELKAAGKKDPSPMERRTGRAHRKDKKMDDRVRKMAAKMKHEGYPSRFTSKREQETHD